MNNFSFTNLVKRHTPKTTKQVVFFVIKVCALCGILIYLLNGLNYKLILTSFSKIPLWAYFLAMGVQLIVELAQALRWKMLAKQTQIHFKEFLGYVCFGQVVSLVSPSMVLVDGLKAYLLGRRNNIVLKSVSSLLIGRVMGLGVLLFFLLITVKSHWWMVRKINYEWKIPPLYILGGVFVIVIAAFLVNQQYKEKILKLKKEIFSGRLGAGQVFILLTLSFIIQFGLILYAFIGYYYTGTPVPFYSFLFVVPLITFITLVPITIGQIGVREGLSVFFLTQFSGVTKEQVLATVGYGYVTMILFAIVNAWGAYILLRKK